MHKKNAFTLLEVVISIMVLTLGVGLILTVFPAALHYFKTSKNTTIATFLAQSKMEELQSFGPNIPRGEFREYPVPDNTNFRYNVEELPLWGGYKEIRVSVTKPQRNKEGQWVSPVYAAVSGISEPAAVGNFAVWVDDKGSTASPEEDIYYFYTDAKNRCIWFLLDKNTNYYPASYGYYSWQQLARPVVNDEIHGPKTTAYIPNNGVPEKLWVIQDPKSDSQHQRSMIFVADSVNNCIWQQRFIPASSGNGTLCLQGDWVRIAKPLPGQ